MAFSIGQKLTAALLNDFDPSGHVHVGTDLTVATTAAITGVLTASNTGNKVTRPYCHAFQSVTQNLTNLVAAAVTMTSETLDNTNGHSTSTNTSRFTPTVGGWYRCIGGVCFAGNVTGDRQAGFRKNGNTVDEAPYGGMPGMNGASFLAGFAYAFADIQCNGTTDYIELWGAQNSGGTLATFVSGGSVNSFMICEWVLP